MYIKIWNLTNTARQRLRNPTDKFTNYCLRIRTQCSAHAAIQVTNKHLEINCTPVTVRNVRIKKAA